MRISSLLIFCSLFGAHAAFCQRLSLGLVGGAPVTSDFDSRYTGYTYPSRVTPGQPYILIEITRGSGPRSPIFGPRLELRLFRNLSVQAEALYRKSQSREQDRSSGSYYGIGTVNAYSDFLMTESFWEIPLLAKWRFGSGRVSPFAAGGVAFRPGVERQYHVQQLSTAGGVMAGGLELRAGRFAIAPELRYARWPQRERGGFAKAGQLEILAAFTFTPGRK